MHSDWVHWDGGYYWNAIGSVFGWIQHSELEEELGPDVIEPNWNAVKFLHVYITNTL